eukprot:56282_1
MIHYITRLLFFEPTNFKLVFSRSMTLHALILLYAYFIITGRSVGQSYEYINPIVNADCPDPGAMFDDKTSLYYVTSTSGNSPNSFPIRISNNLINWTQIGYIFPSGTQPSWTISNYWGPEIHKINDTQYNAYFGATDKTTNLLSIGVATSNNPKGPFIDKIGKPLLNGNISTGIGYIGPHY